MLTSFVTSMGARELPEKVSFGAYRVGSTTRKVVRIDLRVQGGPGFMVTKPSGFVHPFDVAPGKGPNGSYPVVDGQFVELSLTFHPTDNGDFTDTLLLERPPMGNVVDKLLVIVYGRGTGKEAKIIPVDFTKDDPTIYIGDSVGIKRRIPLEKDDPRRFKRLDTTILDAPFFLIISPDSDSQGDEVILGASFQPRQPGVFRDTLAYVRLDTIPGNPTPVELDTIVYLFYGVAKKQPSKLEHSFNVYVNDAPTETSGSFTVESATPYTYRESRITTGPCAFVRVANTSATPDEDRVEYTVGCTPKSVGTFVDTLVIKRFNAKNDVVDSTLVVCTTTVRPRPLVLTLALTPATVAANIGDTISLAVIATADHVPDEPALIKSASFTFAYNATVLIPLTSATVSTDRRGDTSTVTLTRTAQEQVRLVTGSDTIGVIQCVVALGNADRDVVRPLSATLDAEQTETKTYTINAATVTVSDVWEHNGGPRLVNSLRGPCDIVVSPLPMRTTATMKLVNVPTDVGTFHLVRSSGIVVADLTDPVRNGVREFTLTAGSGGGLALSPGTYYARLLVGANGKTVYSVVRMIVVE
ncbi:MAG: hypothetical protein JSS89_10005 [Bacteroidetes bacterium]|nr:hypothetical protein [Bacteroidota bacterium]